MSYRRVVSIGDAKETAGAATAPGAALCDILHAKGRDNLSWLHPRVSCSGSLGEADLLHVGRQIPII
jgi:hypothetical protein